MVERRLCKPIPNNEVLSRFREFLTVDKCLSERTIRGHLYIAEKFLAYTNKHPEEITENDVRAYLAQYRDKARATYANQLKTLKVFFRDFLGSGIANGFKFPEIPFEFKKVPTREELKVFYNGLTSPRDRLIFRLLAVSGGRRSEILSLTKGMVNFENRQISYGLESSSTKKRWFSFMDQETADLLKTYIESKGLGDDERLFPIDKNRIDKVFRKVSEKTGIKIIPKDLRLWFSCEMDKLGLSEKFIDFLQGRTAKTVLRRAYSTYTPERVKEEYDKANLKVLE